MNWLKRTISLLIVVSCLISTAVFSTSAENASMADAEDFAITEKLTSIGVFSEIDTANLLTTVKREDIIPLLLELCSLKGADLSAQTTPFLDVPVTDPMIGGYSALYKLGYITGDENRMFRPLDDLTYNDAITLILNIMEYKVFAVRNGGYPAGYLYTANTLDMLNGLNGQGTDTILWCDVYRLVDRALDARAVSVSVYSADGTAEFELSKTETMLSERYNIRKITGVVTGNENTRLKVSDSSLIDRYQIEINGTVYDTNGLEYADFLGKTVNAYIKKDDRGSDIVLYMEETRNKNEVFELDAENIIKEKSTSNRVYYYDENDKERHVSVNDTELIVVYNGKSRSGYGTLQNVLPQYGTLIALDNNGDDKYDILFIWELKNFLIENYDSYTLTFREKYTDEIVKIDPVEDDVRIYDSEGTTLSFESLTRGALISYAETKNEEGYRLITVYVATNTVTGTVSEVTEDGKVMIGNNIYELAENVENYISSDAIAPIKAGQSLTVTLDMSGKIANVENDSSSARGKYAFVMGAEPAGVIAGAIRLKLYNENGDFLDVETTSKINIDGNRITLSSDEIVESTLSKIPVGDIVIYSMSGEHLSYIDTIAPNYGMETPIADAGNLNLITEGTSFYTKAGICHAPDMKTDKFVVKNKETIVFKTPASDELLEDMEAYAVSKEFSTTKLLYGQYQNTSTRQAIESYAAYNLEDNNINVATCLLLRGAGGSGASGLSRTSKFCVYTKSNDAINEDGETVKRIYYYEGGKEQSYLTDEKIIYSYDRASVAGGTETTFEKCELLPGDVFQFGTDDKGYINAINVVYRQDQSDKKSQYDESKALKDLAWLTMPEFSMQFNTNDGEGAAVGKFMDIDTENGIMMYHMDNPSVSYFIGISKATFEVFRMANLKGEAVTADALTEGDIVLVRSDTGFSSTAAQIVILR